MKRYFDEIKQYTPLSREDEIETMALAKEGNKAAYNKIISHNLKFVVSVAKSYQNKGLPLEELVSEGNMGLLKAFARFDTSRSVKFITYAVWWIRQSIVTALHDNSKLVRLPVNQVNAHNKIYRLTEELERVLKRTPGAEEIEDYLEAANVSSDTYYMYTFIGLDEPRTDNNKDLHEVLPTHDTTLHNENVAKDFRVELDDVLRDFPEREKEIIYLYFGLGDYIRPYTLKEIGYDLGLTRERVRQLKVKVLQKLKRRATTENLRTFLNECI